MIKIIKLASITTIIPALFILSVNTQAEIYKWVDENGGVHYTAQPPVHKKKRVKAKNIEDEIRAAAGKYRPPANSAVSKKEDGTDAEKETVNGEELSGPDKKLISYCTNQKKNLEQLKKNFRNVWIDVKGKKTTLDQEQRKEKVAYLQQRIAEDCKEVK
ncbi:DUF4124 domain-containing protein [uncultured Cocleimonas sp.]|uniref:DUF4124 domain-containing protein n=1 Tax=uncultured Cocleimonas sp. TaxID=1051587 RepID=UPI0026244ACD|nr:DUF4124 domain-containing protein [uncultured Cocleimonas sp.]